MTQPTTIIYLTGKPGVLELNVSNLSPEDATEAIMNHIKRLSQG